MNPRIFAFRSCLSLLAAMESTARIDAQQPAKNDLLGSTRAEAEIRELIDPLRVDQFRLREDARRWRLHARSQFSTRSPGTFWKSRWLADNSKASSAIATPLGQTSLQTRQAEQ